MKKLFCTIAAVCFAFALSAQTDNNPAMQDTGKEHFILHASTAFGNGYFNNKFFVNSFGVDYSVKKDSKTTFFAGTNIFNVNYCGNPADRAPRNITTGTLYASAEYKASDKITLAGDVFYNGLFNAAGANIDFKYSFSENSFIEFSATFIRQLSPSGYNQPVPYWYNEAFHPFIMGY